jgi:hypothetical protein
MYVDSYILLAIYFIAVLSLAVSVYALCSLEEIRQHYAKKQNVKTSNAWEQFKNKPPLKVARSKGYWD